MGIEQGLRVAGQANIDSGTGDPLGALRSLGALATLDGTTVLAMSNLHRFLASVEVMQATAHQIEAGKQTRTILVALSPTLDIPIELQRLWTVVEHELPDWETLAEIAVGVAGEDARDDTLFERSLDAAAGLTRTQAENAFSLSMVRHDRIDPLTVFDLKAEELRKCGLLELSRSRERFADLGGLEALKTFCRRALTRNANEAVRPRGVLLLSPPGCGKSAFAKALGNEVGRPTISLDVGRLMGSLVGQTESNVRQALQIAESMAPCVLHCDEIEKALAGATGSADSGVSARLFGSLLTWLNDHESDVFFVGTCNDISKLPPEFARAERFDGVFFVDLPGRAAKNDIWKMYRSKFAIEPANPQPDDDQWTGAEIKACCRLSALLGVPLVEAAQNVVPVAITAGEQIEKLRQWASGRCLSADVAGPYRPSAPRRRRQTLSSSEPSSN